MRPRQSGGFLVDEIKLHPDIFQPCQRAQRLVHHIAQFFGAAEDIDHIDRFGDIRQRGHAGLAKQRLPRLPRIDRNHLIPLGRKEIAHPVRGAFRFGRGAYEGNHFRVLEDTGDVGIGEGVYIHHDSNVMHFAQEKSPVTASPVTSRSNRQILLWDRKKPGHAARAKLWNEGQ